MKQELQERFIRYAKVETRSDEDSLTIPSSEGQLVLGKLLAQDLEDIGMKDVHIEASGNVIATLPSNIDKKVKTIGFIAHMDTADFNAHNVNPQVHENYDGGDIALNPETVLSPRDFPNLANYRNHTLITTDGTTLLGADDKAGVTEIMVAMHYLLKHPEIKHGEVRTAFSIDEEIGTGAHSFDVDAFACDFAYTLDGSELGQLEYETFNAAGAKVKFTGVSVHPGTAKDVLVNAITLARRFADGLPADEVCEKTEGYEGFYLLQKFTGTIEEAQLSYIIRDHDRAKFEARKQRLVDIAEEINADYPYQAVELEMNDQYYNMAEIILAHPEILDLARQAMKNLQIEVKTEPVRGGTDGSQLSFRGLPTPNLFTGGENFHGRFEFASLDDMEKATLTVIEIIKLNAEEDHD